MKKLLDRYHWRDYLFSLPSFSIILVLITLTISIPTWEGSFIVDDHPNIVHNDSLKITDLSFSSLSNATLSGEASALGRPVSMLTFAINHYFHGMTAHGFKVVNSLIHIANTLLVFIFCLQLIRLSYFKERLEINSDKTIYFLSFSIALIWAITPTNMHSAVYIVQRMNSLAFFFTLSACIFYLSIRQKELKNIAQNILAFIALSILIGLSVLSKENGVLTIPLLVLIEFFIIKSAFGVNIADTGVRRKYKWGRNTEQLFLTLCFWFLLVLPGLFVLYYISTRFLGGINYSHRDFTFEERVLTQIRVVFSYLSELIFPNIYWINYGPDDFPLSSSLHKPISTLYTLLFWVGLLFISLLSLKKWPWLLFGVSWFFIGHSIESTIIPLEMMYFHRNYLPSLGIIFAIVLSVFFIYQQINKVFIKRAFVTFICFYVLFLLIVAVLNVKILGNTIVMLRFNMENHPQSPRAQYAWAHEHFYWYLDNPKLTKLSETAIEYFEKTHQLTPYRISALTNIVLLKHYNKEDYQSELKRLYEVLPQLKNSSQHVSDSRRFVRDNLKMTVRLPKRVFDQYFKIILENPKIRGKHKGLLHQTYAYYLNHQYAEPKDIIEQMEKMVSVYSTLETKVQLLEYLVRYQYDSKAKKLYKAIEQENTLGLYKQRLHQAATKLKL